MSKTSLVIPVYNDAATLKRLLSVVMGFHDLTDIIVADASPNYQIKNLCESFSRVTYLRSVRGRGAQIDAGIKAAKENYIWVLHADSHVSELALAEISRVLSNPKIALGCFALHFDKRHPLLSVFAWISRADSLMTTFGDQGYFFRRKDYFSTDGVAQYPLLEDVILRQMLMTLRDGGVVKSSIPITTSARRFVKKGIWSTQFFNAAILLRYMLGHSPQRLYEAYYNVAQDLNPLQDLQIVNFEPKVASQK